MPPGSPSSASGARSYRRSGVTCAGLPAWTVRSSVLHAELQPALVELGDDLVERLLAEVRDGQQVVLGLDEELTDRVDLGPLQAVARTLRQVEILDREVEVGRTARHRRHLAELEALRLVAHVAHELDERRPRR